MRCAHDALMPADSSGSIAITDRMAISVLIRRARPKLLPAQRSTARCGGYFNKIQVPMVLIQGCPSSRGARTATTVRRGFSSFSDLSSGRDSLSGENLVLLLIRRGSGSFIRMFFMTRNVRISWKEPHDC
jgi:hypothetical protein